MTRDDELRALRPDIKKTKEANGEESFQNKVIRPIIKLQHDVILSIMNNEPNFQKIIFGHTEYDTILELTTSYVKKNVHIKNTLIGVVIGMTTTPELHQYHENANRLNKRIISIIVKRICDTIFEKVRMEY